MERGDGFVEEKMLKIGVISDTHNVLDDKVLSLFKNVDHIFHAGDVGDDGILLILKGIAPVTVIQGNCDCFLAPSRPLSAQVELLGHRIFMIHDFSEGDPTYLTYGERVKYNNFKPDIVISGHTHIPLKLEKSGVLYFNPGSATRPRGGFSPSVGMIYLSGDTVVAEHIFF